MKCIRLLCGLQVLQRAYFTADMEQHMLHNYLKHFRELGVQEALASIPHVSGSQLGVAAWNTSRERDRCWCGGPSVSQQLGWVLAETSARVQVC